MARNVVAACVAALALTAVSGCGTLVNVTAPEENPKHSFPEGTQVYGGVRFSQLQGECMLKESSEPYWTPGWATFEVVMGNYFLFLDTPLSAVGDTLTLPYVLYLHAHKDRPADKPPTTPPVEQAKYTDPPGKAKP
jgi:uncharacterized protein YceK